jgi:hypothetical protein
MCSRWTGSSAWIGNDGAIWQWPLAWPLGAAAAIASRTLPITHCCYRSRSSGQSCITHGARARQFFSDRSTNKSSHFFVCQQPRGEHTQHLLQIDGCETRARERKMRLLCVALCSNNNNMGARACESLLRWCGNALTLCTDIKFYRLMRKWTFLPIVTKMGMAWKSCANFQSHKKISSRCLDRYVSHISPSMYICHYVDHVLTCFL